MISETTLNVLLAELLEKRGLFGASELIFKRREKVRKPDVLVRIQGVRVILEGKIIAEMFFALWINSTPGLLMYLAELEVTRGGWVAMKKGPLESLAVLPPDKLDEGQRNRLVELFKQIGLEHVPLLKEQFRQAEEGKGVRFQLDSELLTTLARRRIGKDDLRPLYTLLAQESEHWESPPAGASTGEE